MNLLFVPQSFHLKKWQSNWQKMSFFCSHFTIGKWKSWDGNAFFIVAKKKSCHKTALEKKRGDIFCRPFVHFFELHNERALLVYYLFTPLHCDTSHFRFACNAFLRLFFVWPITPQYYNDRIFFTGKGKKLGLISCPW